MKKRKPSQTRRHRESVRAKRKARAFYFERQAAKDAEHHEPTRWRKVYANVCDIILIGLAATWLICSIVQLTKKLVK